MIEINLIEEKFRQRTSGNAIQSFAKKGTKYIVIGILVLGVQTLLFSSAFFCDKKIQNINKKLNFLVEANRQVIAQKSEISLATETLNELNQISQRSFYWANLISDMVNSVTQGVWLNRVTIENGQKFALDAKPDASSEAVKLLKIEGVSVGAGQESEYVADFVKQMREKETIREVFEDVQLTSIQQRKIKNTDVYDFRVMCVFRKDKFSES